MGLFRKREESYNEKMLREAGLLDWQQREAAAPEPRAAATPEPVTADPPPFRLEHGLPTDRRLDREWDASTTAAAPGLAGDRIEFTTLPNGDAIVSEEEGDGDVSPLADAVEQHLPPPYRAVATRQDGDLWGIGAKRIEVAKIVLPDADAAELSRKDSWDETRIDGKTSNRAIPELEQLGRRVGQDFYVKAERIDGDLWEVRVSAL